MSRSISQVNRTAALDAFAVKKTERANWKERMPEADPDSVLRLDRKGNLGTGRTMDDSSKLVAAGRRDNGYPRTESADGHRNGDLRPFFSFYGGKWRDARKHYPEPRYDVIVEPFAGSAGYSLRYPSKEVILCEIDPIVASVWAFLIRARESEILSIRDLRPGESVDDLRICEEARWLVGFWLNHGTASPRKGPSKWMRDNIRPGSFWGDRVRRTIASQLEKIRHWKIYNCSYEKCPYAGAATWFVDPPYMNAGKHYTHGSHEMDYQALAAWCKTRRGQVIVCENAGATWLPFRELSVVKTTRANRRSAEVVWIKEIGPD